MGIYLYFKLVPKKTLSVKREKCIDEKLSKEHTTKYVCANIAGTEKLNSL